MSRRRLAFVLFLLVVSTLLAVVINIVSSLATSGTHHPPTVLRLLQRWPWQSLGLVTLLAAIVAVGLYLAEQPRRTRQKWEHDRPPYPGLQAFTQEDAEVFFGREEEVHALLDRLNPVLPRQAHRVVVVVGPSGCGKSSLVKAGLMPRLGKRGRWTVVPPLTPGERPIESLARSLAVALSERTDQVQAELRADGLRRARLTERLRRAKGRGQARVLLVVDQAEELFTLVGERERVEFLELLQSNIQDDDRLWILITLRSEFIDRFQNAGLADLLQAPVFIEPLHREALPQVIEGPAAKVGLELEPRLVSRLVADTTGGDALSLLAFTLQELYVDFGIAGRLTVEQYERLGGVPRALSRQAAKVVAELAGGDAGIAVIPTLLKLVALDESGSSSRPLRRGTLAEPEQAVVDAFIEARLLVTATAEEQAVVGGVRSPV